MALTAPSLASATDNQRAKWIKTTRRITTLSLTFILAGLVPAPATGAARTTTSRKLCSDRYASLCVIVTEYPVPRPATSAINPGGMTPGPDGRMWFTENSGAARGLGALTTSGRFSQYTIPTAGSHPGTIAEGPDRRLWFTEDSATKIGAVTTGGQFSEYPVPTKKSAGPYGIVAGPDGRMWFEESGSDKVGAITMSGQITQYTLAGSRPVAIVSGPDGRVWVVDSAQGRLDAITASGIVSQYSLPAAIGQGSGLAVGRDGRLWVGGASGIAAATTTGAFTIYSAYGIGYQDQNAGGAGVLTSGSDGRLWYLDASGRSILSAISTAGATTGSFSRAMDPLGGRALQSGAQGFASGPDGRVWFSDKYPTDAIGAVTLTSAAAKECVVPDVRRQLVRRARRLLKRTLCKLGQVKGPKRDPVAKEHPKPGSVVPAGTRVNVKRGILSRSRGRGGAR